MTDIAKIAQEAVQKMIDSGEVQDRIEMNIKKAVERAIDDSFSYGSGVRKAIEECVEGSLKLDLKQIDIGTYNHEMSRMLDIEMRKFIQDEAFEKLKGQIAETLVDAPKEISIYELVEQLCNLMHKQAFDQETIKLDFYEHESLDGSCTLKLEHSSLDVNRNKRKLHIFIGSSKKISISHHYPVNPTLPTRVDVYILKLYTAGTVITGLDGDLSDLAYLECLEPDECYC